MRRVTAGKRPILALSTRALLLVVLVVAFGYVLSGHSMWHELLGTGALILNVMFIGFALIDFVDWRRGKLPH